MKPELSIIVPGIRADKWHELYQMAVDSCRDVSFEMVFAGPHLLPKEFDTIFNVKYIKDYASQSRAFQLASYLAEGKYLCLMVDDVRLFSDSLAKSMTIVRDGDEKTVVVLRYIEGYNLGPNRESIYSKEYNRAGYHADLRQPGVNHDWVWGWPLMSTSYFRYLGGVDCQFEHLNMNLHDMLFRAQRDGAHVVLPDFFVCDTFFEEGRDRSSPVLAAFDENDNPMFARMYATAELGPVCINFENWRDAPAVWERRWKRH